MHPTVPPSPITLTVEAASRSYPIWLGSQLLSQAGERLKGLLPSAKLLIIADTAVWEMHGETLANSLTAAGFTYHLLQQPAGESTKSFAVLESLLEAALAHGIDRKTTVVAFGGGVIGDLAGFCASILLRGVPFVQIPTTLLAMVDSSVGGKTGINSRQGKNLIGCFTQPHAVLIDPSLLATLPQRQRLAGYAEVVKYGLIADADFFGWLEENGASALASEGEQAAAAMLHLIQQSCAHKASIVGRDEQESGDRAWLNFGHTLGHALESALGYRGTLLHGEGVAIGMVFASDLSTALTGLPASVGARLRQHLQAVGLPTSYQHLLASDADLSVANLLNLMGHDKKAEAKQHHQGTLSFVLLDQLGQARLKKDVPLALVAQQLEKQQA
jgi:3-dehydroquinate synthase